MSNNPALHIKSKVDERKAIEYYTKEEVNKLLNVATGVFRVYLMIAFNTGLRSGEILGLQLGNFEDKFISIKRTKTKGVIGHGKNWNSKRKVPYPSFILDEVKKIQTNSIFVFNKIDDSGKWQHHWKRCVELAKVKKIRMYCTRHTFATLMLNDNILSINELAGILGHSSVKTTLDKYASVINANTIDLGYNFSLYCDTTVTVKNNISK